MSERVTEEEHFVSRAKQNTAAWGRNNDYRQSLEFSRGDTILAFVMLIFGYLYLELIDFVSLGAGVTLFAILLLTATLIYFYSQNIKQQKISRIWMGITIISAAQFFLFDMNIVKYFNFIFLSMSFVMWVCISTKRQLTDNLSVYLAGDAINQLIFVPFCNWSCGFTGIKGYISRNKHGKSVVSIMIGLILFLPLLIIVTNLLMSADFAFEELMHKVFSTISLSKIAGHVLQFIIGIPIAFYLYGLIYGDAKIKKDFGVNTEALSSFRDALRFVPKLTIYAALTAFSFIYIVFFISQAKYLFSAFSDTLPETFTYAEYARKGFFELCTVAGINFGIMAVSFSFIKREKDEEPILLRVMIGMLSLLTLGLIVTAMSKMAMYINYYGLTQLRVFTSWFMIVLFFVFVVTLIRQIKKFNVFRIVIVGVMALFILLSYGNVDGSIAKYNVNRYLDGTLPAIAVSDFYNLSDAAVPYMYELLEKTTDEELAREVYSAIMRDEYDVYGEEEREGFTLEDYNLQSYRADNIRNKLIEGGLPL